MILLLSLALIVAFSMAFSEEPEKIKVAGVQKTAYIAQHEVEVGDVEGHVFYLNKMEGTNTSKCEHEFMEGAKIITTGFADYIKGNGMHWGYNCMALEGDKIFAEYKGKTTTVLSEEGKPIVTLEGKFKMVKGTGKYENIQGGGTYKAKLVSETELVNEWEGEYFIKK